MVKSVRCSAGSAESANGIGFHTWNASWVSLRQSIVAPKDKFLTCMPDMM